MLSPLTYEFLASAPNALTWKETWLGWFVLSEEAELGAFHTAVDPVDACCEL